MKTPEQWYKEYHHDWKRSQSSFEKFVSEIQQDAIARIHDWAKGLVNCSHVACSISESVYEQALGREALDILGEKS